MNILVTGADGGLGTMVRYAVENGGDIVFPLSKMDCDFSFEDVEKPCREISNVDVIHGIIHCAGVNLLRTHSELTPELIEKVIRVNAISNFIINRHFINHPIRPPFFICHVISDAAWTPMTHSLAYNVSKAAQLMVMRQMAHEKKPDPVIFGVSPGKIAGTGMSEYIDNTFPPMRGMTYEEGRKYQLSRLRTGEMDAEFVADFIIGLCERISPHHHGHNFAIGG
jgi:NAD(P)-dependent dehydrogenase (short-subunit alcohol dehydrogenase family)